MASLWEIDGWSDKEKQKNLQKLEKELVYFFGSVLQQYPDKQQLSTSLRKFSLDIDRHLGVDLEKLWSSDVKIFWGPDWDGLEGAWLAPIEIEKRQEFDRCRQDTKNYLYQYGERYERFWFKEKIFEKFIETFEKHIEQDFQKDVNMILHMILGRGKSRLAGEAEDMSQEIKETIKEGTKVFIKDLKDVRAELKENLRGGWYYWKRFVEIAVPVAVFLTLIITVLRVLKEDVANLFRWLFG